MDRVELRTRHGEGEGMDGFYERTPEIRPSRKNFSRLGWGLTALLLVPVAIQLLLLLVMCAAMFMNFYLAMSIGHLFSRRRILMSVVAFFGLNILDSVITSTLHNMDMMNWLYGMDLSDHAGYWLGILLLLIPTVIMFLLTSWILKHKLNLE